MSIYDWMTLQELSNRYPDEPAARTFMEGRVWPSGPTCPSCKAQKKIITRKRTRGYRCPACALDFNVRTDTILAHSHVPLHIWLYAMHLYAADRAIRPAELVEALTVTPRTARAILQRLKGAADIALFVDEVDRMDWDSGTEPVRSLNGETGVDCS